MRYKGLEITIPLLVSYDVLARRYKSRRFPKEAVAGSGGYLISKAVPKKDFVNYNYSFALLNLNAAIVEGIVRSILSEMVYAEIDSQIARGKSEGRTEKGRSELLLARFLIDLESQGGWENLKEKYSLYLGVSIDKSISSDAKEAIACLFLLRNIMAHGTAIIQPSEQMADELKDEPLFKWQSRLQSARVYLKRTFGNEAVFDNLAEYAMPEHFLEMTKKFFEELIPALKIQPSRSKETLEILRKFSFGFANVNE